MSSIVRHHRCLKDRRKRCRKAECRQICERKEKLVWGDIKINEETKAIIEIIFNEVLEKKNIRGVRKLLKTWVKANDLHPELVKHGEGGLHIAKVRRG